jgi:hypothetical protein
MKLYWSSSSVSQQQHAAGARVTLHARQRGFFRQDAESGRSEPPTICPSSHACPTSHIRRNTVYFRSRRCGAHIVCQCLRDAHLRVTTHGN